MASEDYEPSHGYMNDLTLTLHFHHQALFAILVILIVVIVFIAFSFFNFARSISGSNARTSSLGVVEGVAEETGTGTRTRNKGLDEASINSLPMYLHSSLPFSEEDGIRESECAICLGTFLGNEMIKVIPTCLHAYHSACVDKWLKSQAICPLCRATLPSLNGPVSV